jgi:protein-S-isoprenylcysteine O-methyltransferase Ste14
MKAKTEQILKLYFSSIFVYLIGILIFRYLPYYKKILSADTQATILMIFSGYLVLAPLFYLITVTKYSENKPLLVLRGVRRFFTQFRLEKKEKVALLFMLVKLFYLPLMINFFFNNFNSLSNQWDTIAIYPLILISIFTLDTLVFAFGYIFEFKFLNNVVKSVEPTFFGWFVALVCYPPFNSIVGKYLAWGANDYVHFWTDGWTIFFRIIVISLLMIYLWATFALGFKASNLTNRGIVAKFPYNIIRHPAYISKNLAWWITMIPIINWKFALGMGVWSLIYFFRAFTEERHLSLDPDYIEYKKKVKWRFIPGVY